MREWPVTEEEFACGRVRKIGNIYVLTEWTTADGKKRRLVLGPYWHFLLVTIIVVASVCVMVYGFVVPVDCKIERVVGLTLTVLTLTSLLCTALNDPGIFPRYSKPLGPSWTFSEYAQSHRPPGVIFCQQCQVLIEDYNHFCPWSGIVIGKGNEVYFQVRPNRRHHHRASFLLVQVFIVSIVVSFVYDLVVIALSLNDICTG